MFTQLWGGVGWMGWWGVSLMMMGVVLVASRRKHLLATLLSLELTVLGAFLLLGWGLMLIWSNYVFGLVFLTLAVCEGSLGLAVAVVMVRAHGNDYFQGISIL
uniref:NADH-ubiquinone oxidoreductase chain 4L n=1 Tax=Eudohrnia metallica TaxID=2021301 RepID=A0A678PAH4_9NEOP|nr:NADH dehydrogenase subunit 4L [Eudohrnia metallica]